MRVRAFPMARAMSAAGHKVLMVMPPWHTPGEGGRTWEQDGVCLEYVRLPLRHPLAGSASTVWRMVRSVSAWQPDVVHCFKPVAYSGCVSALLWHLGRLRRGRPALVVDEDDWEGKGGWHEMLSYGRLTRDLFARQERRTLTHCDGVTVASRALESLVWSLGAEPSSVRYVPNGSDMTPDPEGAVRLRTSLGIGDAPVLLLYTRFFEYDVARAVAVYRRVAAQVDGVRLLVVGRGLRERDEERFDALVAAAGLSDSVSKVGWIPMHDLPAYLAVGDAALYPFDDNLLNRTKCPAKLADLLAAGCPVVAEAVGENALYIANGSTGFLASSGDIDGLAGACVHLLQDRESAERMGREAATRMRTEYGWPTLAARALRLYADTAG